jgi:hypothetical protein
MHYRYIGIVILTPKRYLIMSQYRLLCKYESTKHVVSIVTNKKCILADNGSFIV